MLCFCGTGYNALIGLDLGNKFNTSRVTNMTGMFRWLGFESLTSLRLGDNFDTRNVTDMSFMFNSTGEKTLKTLNLGDKFYTTKVMDMRHMFSYIRYITELDLGPAFTQIANVDVSEKQVVDPHTNGTYDYVKDGAYKSYTYMFEGTGTNSDVPSVIYVSSKIYYNNTTFKTSINSNVTIVFNNFNNGTINSKYGSIMEQSNNLTNVDFLKPVAVYNSSNLSMSGSEKIYTMEFNVTDQNYYEGLLNLNDLKIKIDGESIEGTQIEAALIESDITQNVDENEKIIIGKKYTLTLLNLEQIQTKDNSIVTVDIPGDQFVDSYGNRNIKTTITASM